MSAAPFHSLLRASLTRWWCLVGLLATPGAGDHTVFGTEFSPDAGRTHWAFQSPREPALPEVKRQDWVRNDLDRFILAKLEAHGLEPSAPADRRTLIRRATYDLLGLPPTLEEIEAFERDANPGAFERVVERLLASRHYGERWGRYWLDVVRYADTKGYVFYYEESQFVQPFRYRDWVIRAFNADLPYDQFLLQQIAADQLVLGPEPRSAKNSATTYSVGGGQGKPSLAAMGMLTLGRRFLGNPHDIIDDQLDVLIRGTQALTIGCARCHDHKFDPIPMRDYYALYGVLQGSQERIVALEDPPKPDQLMAFGQAKAYLEFEQELKKRTERLETAFAKAAEQVADRLRDRCSDYLVALSDPHRLPTLSANVRPAPGDLNPYNVRQWQTYLDRRRDTNDSVFGAWFIAQGLAGLSTDRFAREAGESLAGWRAPGTARALPNRLVAAVFTNAPASLREVAECYGRVFHQVHLDWQREIAQARSNNVPAPERLPDAAAEQLRQVLYATDAPVRVPQGSMVELDVHLYFDDPNRVALSKMQMEIEQWLDQAPGAPAHAVVLQDRAVAPANAVVFRRGDPAKPGEVVPRRFLEVVGGAARPEFREGSGRLELARAIADRRNPLTARVMVNRIWLQHFGAGLVRTSSDFGVRSEAPSHPELLDWLALRFVDDGWSIKQMHRRILASATYQQATDSEAGEVAAGARRLDPENRWLGRMNRRRLDYEAMRDSILAVTGELDLTAGGRAIDFEASGAPARRTVYGRIDRKYVPGVLRAFDFANPDLHTSQRFTTVVPQQALYLWNSPFLAERARALARRSAPKGTTIAVDARIRRLYELAYRRSPTDEEQRLAGDFVAQPPAPPEPGADTAWVHGFGRYDAEAETVQDFAKLTTYRSGTWRAGEAWPDPKLGAVQLTPEGGHASADRRHSAVRRWIAPRDGGVKVEGWASAPASTGAVLVAHIVSSRHGEMARAELGPEKRDLRLTLVRVERGDAIDFVVEHVTRAEATDSPESGKDGATAGKQAGPTDTSGLAFEWSPVVRSESDPVSRGADSAARLSEDAPTEWNARRDFCGPRPEPPRPLDAWEQLAQVLLVSNEFMFVD